MSNICLPPKIVDKFTGALKSGKIDPGKLSSMTSEARHKFFKDLVGEDHAKTTNALFESKMLLKNQKYAYVSWAKKVAGITPEVRRDLITRIGKLDHILNPVDEKRFLKDLASTRLGMDVTQAEAKKIAMMSNRVIESEALPRSTKADALKKGWQPTTNDMKYGYAKHDLSEHINDLTHKASKFNISDLKGLGVIKSIPRLAQGVADISKSLGASLDNSFALRQGAKAFWTNNRLWQQEFRQSFVNIAKGLKDANAVRREFEARLMADPVYDQAIKDGLRVRGNEDAFPTSLPEKIPIFGRAFGATEVAYGAFAQNLRLAIYKNQMRLAEDLKGGATKDFGKNIAKEVNSLTGAGGFGKAEPVAGYANVAFYSLRFLKSNVDTLLLHPAGVGVGGIGSAAQKTAAKNLVKIIAGTAVIMGVANALKPGSAEFDPRSSDFGKIRIGNTRFDITGGMSSIVILAARVASNSTKSSTTGMISKLNTGVYGAPTEKDIVSQFFENKASPIGGVLLDKLNGKTHSGDKPTIKNETLNLVTPLGIKNFLELKNDPNSANLLASMIADSLGVSTNTYGKSSKNYSMNPSPTLQAFHNKVGDAAFKQANNDYNTRYDQWLATNKKQLDSLPNDQIQSVVTAAKAKIQSSIYKEHNFKPPKSTQSQSQKATQKSLLQSIR